MEMVVVVFFTLFATADTFDLDPAELCQRIILADILIRMATDLRVFISEVLGLRPVLLVEQQSSSTPAWKNKPDP